MLDFVDPLLDVDGDLSIGGAVSGQFSSGSEVKVAGAYNAGIGFEMLQGTLILDGGTTASASWGGQHANLRVLSGSKTIDGDALLGLALGEEAGVGWATFSGKNTYQEPTWVEPIGNHTFVVYVEDHGEPGAGADRFWIEVLDNDGNTVTLSMDRDAVDNTVTLGGGNIVVPH